MKCRGQYLLKMAEQNGSHLLALHLEFQGQTVRHMLNIATTHTAQLYKQHR